MKHGRVLAFLLVLFSLQLTAQKEGYASFLEEGETILSEDYQRISTKLKDGSFRRRQFFPEKMLLTDLANYSDARETVLHGPYRTWFDNGHRRVEANYVDGKLHGPYRQYAYANDSLAVIGQYEQGRKIGDWTVYHPSGEVRKREYYEAGKPEVAFTKYDTLGVITEQGLMLNDSVISYSIGQGPNPNSEEMPQFPGCEEIEDRELRAACAKRKMMEFVNTNLRYPSRAAIKEVQGKAEVGFVVERDGSVTNINVIHGLNADISRELERIIHKMPNWHPGLKDGQPVRVEFSLPVTFKLQ